MAYAKHAQQLSRRRLPLLLTGRVAGKTHTGKSTPEVLPTSEGVVISRDGLISCLSHDLQDIKWERSVTGWTQVHEGPTFILHKEFKRPSVQLYQKSEGELLRSLDVDCKGGIAGVASCSFLLLEPEEEEICAVSFEGERLWRHRLFGNILASAGTYLIVDMENRLHAFDERTGEVLWTFQASAVPNDWRANNISKLVVIENRVLVVVGDGRIYDLSKHTGQITNRSMRPATGPLLITETSMFFQEQWTFEVIEWDHRTMKEVGRTDVTAEVKALFPGDKSYNSLLVGQESFLWTTMSGRMIAVSRESAIDGKRATWVEDIPGALMPLGKPPTVWEEYIYFTIMYAPALNRDNEIRCWKASS